MKFIASVLVALTALLAAVSLSGFSLDVMSVSSLAFAALIAGGFVTEYARTPARPYDAPAPAATPARRHRREAGTEFATFATFHTMV